jgi:hypothetical protein
MGECDFLEILVLIRMGEEETYSDVSIYVHAIRWKFCVGLGVDEQIVDPSIGLIQLLRAWHKISQRAVYHWRCQCDEVEIRILILDKVPS